MGRRLLESAIFAIILGAGNAFYALISSESPSPWDDAIERTFFQAIALLLFAFLGKLPNDSSEDSNAHR